MEASNFLDGLVESCDEALKKTENDSKRFIANNKKFIVSTKEIKKDYENRKLIVEKYQNNPPKNEEELKELMSITCYHNLAFCCKKACPFRNAVLMCIGMKPEDFENMKSEWGLKNFIK